MDTILKKLNIKRHIDGTHQGQFINILFKAKKKENVVGRSVARCPKPR
tara:strand:- start:6 stop:149 length:144 start_codon:yes stop_codon:yes gene_type:complete